VSGTTISSSRLKSTTFLPQNVSRQLHCKLLGIFKISVSRRIHPISSLTKPLTCLLYAFSCLPFAWSSLSLASRRHGMSLTREGETSHVSYSREEDLDACKRDLTTREEDLDACKRDLTTREQDMKMRREDML
jgi:hypothetical protein